MLVRRRRLPDGIAGVVFGGHTVVVARELRAVETIRTLTLAIALRSTLFAVVWLSEVVMETAA